MGILIKHDLEKNYCLFDIPYIREYQEEIINTAETSVEKINALCNSNNTNVTWFYRHYNIFSINTGNVHFYKIYSEIIDCLTQYFDLCKISYDNQLWMQSWLNYHSLDQVLSRHDHDSPINGFLSIDPKNTDTVYYYQHTDSVLYTIENKIGQLYIGPGKTDHEVKVLKPFEGKRITVAFDIEDQESINLGLIPILLQQKK